MHHLLSQSSIFTLIVIVLTIIIGLITYLKWKLTYWNKTGLPTLPTTFPFGNAKELILGQRTWGEHFCDLYGELKRKGHTKHAGLYFAARPIYVPISPDHIKIVTQKDFDYFPNHGNYVNEDVDPLSAHLFSLSDTKWKQMRTKLTPTFTSGKMKMIFQTMADCTVGLKDVMDDAAIHKTPLDIKDVLGRFNTDIIGSVAFGIECNSLKNPDAEFRKYGIRVFLDDGTVERMKTLSQYMVPHSILHAMKFKIIKPDVEKFFMNVIRETVEDREKNNIRRDDFMHLLLQLRNQETVKNDGNGDVKTIEKGLTLNEVAAQAYVFFIAGFETSSTTMTFALYELALNSTLQDRVRDEITTMLTKHDNKLTYDGIMEMTYLDKVIFETLRKYPPVPILNRKCIKEYKIPGTSAIIKPGMEIFIPTLGIHTDPDYYPNPEMFDPERFTEENKNSRPAYTWLPFGEGPRTCIGMRFGMLQSKVGLAALLRNYRIKLSTKTKLPLQLNKNSLVTAVEGEIWLEVEKINSDL